jgi:hypothetical protein
MWPIIWRVQGSTCCDSTSALWNQDIGCFLESNDLESHRRFGLRDVFGRHQCLDAKRCNQDGTKCCKYVLVYSDDFLVFARNPGEILAHMDQHFKLKDSSVQSPTSYLGADVGKYSFPDGSEAWYLSSNSYVKEAIRNVVTWLHKREKDNSGW